MQQEKTYLSKFILPDGAQQDLWTSPKEDLEKRSLYGDVDYVAILRYKLNVAKNSVYPFRILNYDNNIPFEIQFDKITIFYGSNGSGKSTLLNVIAEKINAERNTEFNASKFFPEYCSICQMNFLQNPQSKRIIASDEIFEKMLSLRDVNTYKLDRSIQLRDERKEALDNRVKEVHFDDIESVKKFERNYNLRRLSLSKTVMMDVGTDINLQSNGETAYNHFLNMILPNSLYLLDEPENSLSARMQGYLASFIKEMADKGNCQFIIATHSPFFLSIPGAKIYNLDNRKIVEDKWTNLPTIRAYYELFKKHEAEFEQAQ